MLPRSKSNHAIAVLGCLTLLSACGEMTPDLQLRPPPSPSYKVGERFEIVLGLSNANRSSMFSGYTIPEDMRVDLSAPELVTCGPILVPRVWTAGQQLLPALHGERARHERRPLDAR